MFFEVLEQGICFLNILLQEERVPNVSDLPIDGQNPREVGKETSPRVGHWFVVEYYLIRAGSIHLLGIAILVEMHAEGMPRQSLRELWRSPVGELRRVDKEAHLRVYVRRERIPVERADEYESAIDCECLHMDRRMSEIEAGFPCRFSGSRRWY